MATIDLLEKIEDCRSDMVSLAMETSFADKRVIEISVQLDQLLNQFEQTK